MITNDVDIIIKNSIQDNIDMKSIEETIKDFSHLHETTTTTSNSTNILSSTSHHQQELEVRFISIIVLNYMI
jgi:hypothetical protein